MFIILQNVLREDRKTKYHKNDKAQRSGPGGLNCTLNASSSLTFCDLFIFVNFISDDSRYKQIAFTNTNNGM